MSSLKKASLTYCLLPPEPKSWNWRTTKAGWNKSWGRKWPLMVSSRGQTLPTLCSLWVQLSQPNVRCPPLASGEDSWAELPSSGLSWSSSTAHVITLINYTDVLCRQQGLRMDSCAKELLQSPQQKRLSALCSTAGCHSILELLCGTWDHKDWTCPFIWGWKRSRGGAVQGEEWSHSTEYLKNSCCVLGMWISGDGSFQYIFWKMLFIFLQVLHFMLGFLPYKLNLNYSLIASIINFLLLSV